MYAALQRILTVSGFKSLHISARRLALEWGLLTCSGRTPEATMASSLYGDIKRRDHKSVFIRPQEGLFGLKEWIDQGYLPPMPDNSVIMAQTKRGCRPTQVLCRDGVVGLGGRGHQGMQALRGENGGKMGIPASRV